MKNRTFQLIFQTAYCAFALVGTAGSLGFFYNEFYGDFYIFFTNISSVLCFAVMLAELVQTAKRNDDGYVTALPIIKFVSMLGTLLTFMVYNFLLSGNNDPAEKFKIGSVMFHMLLPLMYIADWLMFYERGKCRWTYPLISALFPLLYCGFIFVHAALWNFDSSIMNDTGLEPLIYPYFFLNPDKVGVTGVLQWTAVLLSAFVLTGYLFMGLDRLLLRKKKTR